MFDIGFWELILITVIALVVIGPERLPRIAYATGAWVGKLQRMIRSLRIQLEHEFDTHEFREMVERQEAEIRNLKNMLTDTPESKAVDDLIGDVKALNRESRQARQPNPSKQSDQTQPSEDPKDGQD